MSFQKGLTTWIVQAGFLTVALRWNMSFRHAVRTVRIIRGARTALACGPLLVEW